MKDSNRFPRHHGCHFSRSPKKICFRWNCIRPECRHAKALEVEHRIMFGAEQCLKESDLFFVTFQFKDEHDAMAWDAPETFQRETSKVFRSLRDIARKAGVLLRYARTFAMKTSLADVPFEMHSHDLINWLPDAQSAPTPANPNHHHSQILTMLAERHGLTVFILKVDEIPNLAQYIVRRNLSELHANQLPKGFRRCFFSRNWCSWTKHEMKSSRERAVGLLRSGRYLF